MIGALRTWTDQFLGRGAAAITVPIFDGALKPNQILEQAETFAELEAPEDLATDGNSLFVANGASVLRYDDDTATKVAQFDRRITGLAILPHGGLAVALDGTELRVIGGPHDGRTWSSVAGKPLNAANAICTTDAHARVAVGLDYLGAAPVRGTRYGGGNETLTVAVRVEQVGRPGQWQSQS